MDQINDRAINRFLAGLEEALLSQNQDLSLLSGRQQLLLLESRAINIMSSHTLRRKLERAKETGVALRVKYGIDPTGKSIHLGHIVPVILLQRLQRMGHHIIFLIGDFTALIGDPSGKVSTRPVLTREEIAQNMANYQNQIKHLINLDHAEIRCNSEWFNGFPLARFFEVLGAQTVGTALQREDFRNRESITRAEVLYSTMMGIDSFELKADIEVGGNDQLLNFMDAKRIMKSMGAEPEIGITTPILQGTNGNGRKMSKSAGNYIALDDSPEDIYGKVMSIPDNLMEEYFKLLTDITDAQWVKISSLMTSEAINPKLIKQLLARVIVSIVYGSFDIAQEAQMSFDRLFSQKALPQEMPTYKINRSEIRDWVDLLVKSKLAASRNEARRLINGGAIKLRIADKISTIMDNNAALPLDGNFELQAGKRHFAHVELV